MVPADKALSPAVSPAEPHADFWRSLLWLSILLGLSGVNFFVFRALWSVNYLDWYRHAGSIIGLVTSVFSVAWGGMDKNTGLVSADPRHYGGACLQVAGLPILAFGGHLRNQTQHVWLDTLFGLPLILAFAVGGIAWLLLIAPLQYFVFLVCGAPSRIALRSSFRVSATMTGNQLTYREHDRPENTEPGLWDASLRDKPVVLASLFSALLFMLLDWTH